MITVSKGSAEQGASYFSHDDIRAGTNYYTEQSGQWYGSGAKDLGLSGVVKKKEFLTVLKGMNLNDEPLTRNAQKTDVENKRVAYTDVTISAPKSVSLMSVVDPRIKDAHRRAVEVTLTELEENYSLTRTGTNGVNKHTTGSMAIAAFEHEESRELDVQLHTHCVIVNATKRHDGKWGALENRPILQDQKLLDLTYQAHLTDELQKLGYDTVRSSRKGVLGKPIEAVEIAGISDELILQNSARLQQVKDNAEKHRKTREALEKQYQRGEISKKLYTSSKRELIKFDKINSRKSKDLEKSKVAISEKRESIKFALKEIPIPQERVIASRGQMADEFVKSAIASIAETNAVFERKTIVKTALLASIGTGVTAKDINSRINDHTILLSTGFYTTQEILDAAETSISIAKRGKGTATQKVNHQDVEAYLQARESEGVSFAVTQRKAIVDLCETNDLVSILQGNAGTGKTFAITHLKNILETNGFTVRGLAPTGKASEGLREAGLESSTLDSFFMKDAFALGISYCREVWVVDECSMVGNINMAKLLKKAEESYAKVVLLGDIKQLQAVSAGRAFGELQEYATITQCEMTEVIRQKTEHMKEIVALSTVYNGNDALRVIADRKGIKTYDSAEKRLESALWSAFKAKDSGQSVVVLTQTNDSRERVNAAMREKLRERGEIGEDQKLWTLSSMNVSGPARLHAASYEPNIIINFSVTTCGVPSGSQGQVERVNIEKNTVELKVKNITTGGFENVEIPVGKHGTNLQLYRPEKKEFAIGDELIFLKNDLKLEISNGLTGKITGLDTSGNLTVQSGSKEIKFHARQYPYFDHGYAMTNHKVQGATFDQAVILCDDSSRTNSQEWYVGVTRARYDVTVVTDNLEQMQENVTISQPKESVLDHTDLEKATTIAANQIIQEKDWLIAVERAKAQQAAEEKRQAELAIERAKQAKQARKQAEQAELATQKEHKEYHGPSL